MYESEMHGLHEATTSNNEGGLVKRVSWGAIFAGAVVVVAIQLALALLGLGLGAGTVEPFVEPKPLAGLGIAATIWIIVSSLIALFAGGIVAGRLANQPRALDG